ncbi:MAG: geranyltranstransferase [Rickettsiales bacterium]|jgi:farnesyl diphosphate synthase|nr:geranyltranstransferase [Rickettsiales bacterium]
MRQVRTAPDLQETLLDVSHALFEKMSMILPEPEVGKGRRLLEAMRYSALSEGKRLRPFLTVTSANLFGVSRTSALQAASAIEFIHAYSLVHDDLPAMDNDDLRRGQPSCHKKYDDATAILAGDALLTFAFEVLASESTHYDSSVRAELVCAVAQAAGHQGMVGGQMLDMSVDHSKLGINEITRMQRMKTGALFVVSCEVGAILGKASRGLRNALRGYANDLGLAFQITDDLLDAEAAGVTDADTDFSYRTDKTVGKATFVTALGEDKAREQAKILAYQAISHLSVFDERADLLRQLAHFVVERQN